MPIPMIILPTSCSTTIYGSVAPRSLPDYPPTGLDAFTARTSLTGYARRLLALICRLLPFGFADAYAAAVCSVAAQTDAPRTTPHRGQLALVGYPTAACPMP